jgi:type II secretory ATPase GspE/PulE/Tfp pilus assembly ATPase PilB-like protein
MGEAEDAAQRQSPEGEVPITGVSAVASLQVQIQDLARRLRSVLEEDDRSSTAAESAQAGAPAPTTDPVSIAIPLGLAPPAANPRRMGKHDYLVAQRFVTREQLAAATAEARNRQMSTESVLMEKYSVRKSDIVTALTMYYRHPFMSLDNRFVLAPELAKFLSGQRLKTDAWIPIKREGDAVVVLVDDPHDLPKIDSIEKRFGSTKVRFAVGIRENILEALDVATGAKSATGSVADILGEIKEEDSGRELPDLPGVEIGENDSTIIRLVNQIIVDAHRARASDIHVEPCGPMRETSIRFRIDGTCMEYQTIPASLRNPLVARLKIMATLDIAERRKPQDGKIKMRRHDGSDLELRVATIPTVGANEDVVMRLLGSTGALPIDGLLLSERNLRELKAIAKKPYGLILCVGPTGSGKTTTLHAALGHINTPERKIWTAEDPVEITQPGLRQVQVHPNIGYTFAAAMRAFLRADPDVIMVGEMRDLETAQIAVEASLTGHLVFSTLHTNSAAETVVRLLDLGVNPFNFADALLGVLAQRLVKRVCDDCATAYHPTPDEWAVLAGVYGDGFDQARSHPEAEQELRRGKGCESCNGTGYRGRLAIHELLIGSDAIKRLTLTRAPVLEVLAQARKEGMVTLVQDGVLKVLQGLTTFDQVRAAALR